MSLNTVQIRTGTNVLLIALVTACLTLKWYKSRCLPVDLRSVDAPGPVSRAEVVGQVVSSSPVDSLSVVGNATYIHQCDSFQEDSSITFRLICPPGYTRRLPEILILGDSFTGLPAVEFLLQYHTELSTGHMRHAEYFSQPAAALHELYKYCQLMPCVDRKSTLKVVDGSQQSFPSSMAPRNAFDCNPTLKILLLVRNPVELLLLKTHRMYIKRYSRGKGGKMPQSVTLNNLKDMLFKGGVVSQKSIAPNHFLRGGEYAHFISEWTKYFRLNESLMIVDFRELKSNPFEVIHRIEEFFGIPHQVEEDSVSHYRDNCFCHVSPFKNHVGQCMTKECNELIPEIPDNLTSVLKSYYSQANEDFFRRVNTDFGWNS